MCCRLDPKTREELRTRAICLIRGGWAEGLQDVVQAGLDRARELGVEAARFKLGKVSCRECHTRLKWTLRVLSRMA